MTDPRRHDAAQLCTALAATRALTLQRSLDLTDDQWVVPRDPCIQPTFWDLAHIGWFAETWVLRGPHHLRRDGFVEAAVPGRFFPQDAHYDSAVVAHEDRWKQPTQTRDELIERLAGQLEAVQQRVRSDYDESTRYFAHLALFHECMHAEALAWTRATCGYPAPPDVAMPEVPAATQLQIEAGEHTIGAQLGEAFAFDNEMPRHRIELAGFSIDSHPVRNDAFRTFVEDGGYQRQELWPEGLPGRSMPERWRRAADGSIEHRHYDRWLPLPETQPVVHVNAFEAEAYCRWAGRRLPTPQEWEAASRHMTWGRMVWEWTASMFAPYGQAFRPGPYVTYSTPWFHHQRELRGGAYTTDACMHDCRYRNFFLPQRADVFAGFRTASLA